jgi:hypothetical protein
MKTLKTITLALSILGISYLIYGCFPNDRIVEIKKPNLPAWVFENYYWSNYYQEAYEDGRIWFNEDSTMMVVSSPGEKLDEDTEDWTIDQLRKRNYSVESKTK